MLIIITCLLVLTLGAIVLNLILITKIQHTYENVLGGGEGLPTWRRKRGAFILFGVAELIGFVSLIWPFEWAAVIYLGLFLFAFLGFADAYRILLQDSKLLPRKK